MFWVQEHERFVCYTVRVSLRLVVQSSDCIFYCIVIFQCVLTKQSWLKPEIYLWKPCNRHWARDKRPTEKGMQWKYQLKQTATRVCQTVTIIIYHISPICCVTGTCLMNFFLYRCKPVGNNQHPKTLHLNCGNWHKSRLTDHHPSQNINWYSKCLKRYQSGKWMRV